MKTLNKNIMLTVLLAVFQLAGMSAYAGFNCSRGEYKVKLENGYRQDRSDYQFEDLDKNNFANTGYTSGWSSIKRISIYQLGGSLEWKDECSRLYARVRGHYGWILHGKAQGFPLNWNVNGHTNDVAFRVGYMFDVCNCFTFVPVIGYGTSYIKTKLKNQPNCSQVFGPNAYSNHSGDRTTSRYHAPFIGFDLRFSNCFCCRKVDFLFGYDFHYGNLRVKKSPRRFVLTDDINTSNYGYKINAHNVVTNRFRLSATTNITACIDLGLDFEYSMRYNTCKNRVHLQRNDEIVATGQFTPSQFHVSNRLCSNSFLINLMLGYNF